MPESIESFVKKLQTEGVDAGRQAAEKIKKEAMIEAEKIVADAKSEATAILEKAGSDAEKELARAQTELELAVRDGILKLRESLGRTLSVLLARRLEEKLSEPDYLADIVREVVRTYAKADAELQAPIEINLSEEMRDQLDEGVFNDLSRVLGEGENHPDLRATFTKAGFEYKIRSATVEVSPESVADLLSEMVGPALREIVDRVAGRQGRESTGKTRTEPNENSH